ncbi:hypothetical protein BD560DRAFT_401989 [Blakeslea trispora]|nr:hypothetical protein BD560DRAFT_401989 [Blakeslea trispora]
MATYPHDDIEDEESSKLPKPSSLLLKRLAPKHGHTKNLTILTSSYNEAAAHSIQSAPLKRSTAHPLQVRSTKLLNKVVKRSPPTATLKSNYRRLVVPATASAISAPWPQTSIQARFPSPPIVPSQQPAWSQQNKLHSSNALKTTKPACLPRTPHLNTPSINNTFTHINTTVNTHTNTTNNTRKHTHSASPTPPSQYNINPAITQKQKFLQPFEFLYDHIEQTRALKSTLDDQIRRSSSLMQTLQSSTSMIESLVRKQVRDTVDQQFEGHLRKCADRISRLEYRASSKDRPISPSVSPSPTNKEQDALTQLMNRIDQLETRLAYQKAK